MTGAAVPHVHASFAHASEAELARILDFYDVRWRYEPDTYPIRWNLDGDVLESFSPDFYLPDPELYVELTTLKQKLVRKKNRKLRRLRELYPDIRIKLFYARDFRMLMLKFGRMALIEDMTGTTGQSTPPRPHAPASTAMAVPDTADAAGEDHARPLAGEDRARALAGEDHAPALAGEDHAPALAGPGTADVRSRRRGRRRRRASEAAAAALIASPAGAEADGEPA